MITEQMMNTVYNVHNCIQNKFKDEVLEYINTVKAEEIALELLNDDDLLSNKNHITYTEMLKWFIEFCSYVEEETNVPAIISDDLYDKLVAKLISLGEEQPIGSPLSTETGIGERQHKYPELRGSLSKVHFIWEKDVPKNDSRKSLEGYFNNVVRQLKSANLPINDLWFNVSLKYDGVSHIIEGHNGNFDHILTRGDVGTNTGKDLTATFAKFFPDTDSIDTRSLVDSLELTGLPDELLNNDLEFGVKVETYMPTNLYTSYEEQSNDKKCNRRSAVVSICNQSPENIKENDDLSSYLRMASFQISTTEPIEFDSLEYGENSCWKYIGEINGRHQYLYAATIMEISLENVSNICEILESMINHYREQAEILQIPIDGIVLSFLDESVVKLLGRKNDKNMFQVAFKFPAGEEKTTIEGVDFQVGPVAGILTPVARLKPIKINGNTISNVTVCNKAKLDRLKLHIGDEVIIHYDIVPSIFKDSSCKETDNELIVFPTNCPICNGAVDNERCINPDCPSKLMGQVMNFIEKNRIKGGLGLQTVIDFVNAGFIETLGDIYRLYKRREELYNLPNYGRASIDAIIASIFESKSLYPHEVLGAIGIPSVGLKKMEKICRKLNILGNIDYLDELLPEAINIPGIGEKTAMMAFTGIQDKKAIIEDLCTNIEIKPYTDNVTSDISVCFTLTRDADFERFLIDNGVNVSDSITSKVKYLIVSDETKNNLSRVKQTTKLKKAIEKGIEIISLSEAKDKWKYK